MTILNNIRLLLLASWLGAAIFFSAAVAPSAFRVLRAFNLPNASEIAGSIVTRTLSVVNTSGFVFSVLLLVTVFVLKEGYGRRALILQAVLLLIVAITTGVGEWIIAAKMRSLRAALQTTIDQVPAGDPSRMAFDALHGYSVTALSIAIVAGLIAFFAIANRAK
jgi:ABC-type transport system involved in cytochrome bd biosynthesis fused ATPase/permease subunit